MQWIEGPVALRRRLDHLQPTPVRCWESSYGFVTTRKLLARCGARNAADGMLQPIKRLARNRTPVA